MVRCVIVGGLPLIPRTERSRISKQIDSLIRQGIRDLGTDIARSNKSPTRPFKIEVTINEHQRLREIVTVVFSDQFESDVVAELCDLLRKSAAKNPILVTQSHEEGLERHDDFCVQADGNGRSAYFIPSFSLGAGSIRDHALPSMPWLLRRQVQFDGVGVFSLTHERAANRTAKLLRCFVKPHNDHLVIDGMAGVGGNTMGFLKYWNAVVAVEVDTNRASMLKTNIELWETWQNGGLASSRHVDVQNLCLIDYLARQDLPKSGVLLFLDPPWGGPQYHEKIVDGEGDIVMLPNNEDFHPITHANTEKHIVDCQGEWRFSNAVVKLARLDMFHVIALKLPHGFDEALVVNPLVHVKDLEMERIHPFRFHFGNKVKLIVLVRNNGDDPDFANGPAGLDRMIRNIMEWHNSPDLQGDDGCREHRPEFYDWEKYRWIMLKKWKGSKETSGIASSK